MIANLKWTESIHYWKTLLQYEIFNNELEKWLFFNVVFFNFIRSSYGLKGYKTLLIGNSIQYSKFLWRLVKLLYDQKLLSLLKTEMEDIQCWNVDCLLGINDKPLPQAQMIDVPLNLCPGMLIYLFILSLMDISDLIFSMNTKWPPIVEVRTEFLTSHSISNVNMHQTNQRSFNLVLGLIKQQNCVSLYSKPTSYRWKCRIDLLQVKFESSPEESSKRRYWMKSLN